MTPNEIHCALQVAQANPSCVACSNIMTPAFRLHLQEPRKSKVTLMHMNQDHKSAYTKQHADLRRTRQLNPTDTYPTKGNNGLPMTQDKESYGIH